MIMVVAGVVGYVFIDRTKNKTDSANEINIPAKDVKIYESPRLGIRFKYASQENGRNVLIKETGDTVYVYTQDTAAEEGQFVRVLAKDTDETLAQAVNREFLTGYNDQQCFITSWDDDLGPKPNAGITAVISFPKGPTDSVTPWWENGKNCPLNYSVSNGLAYFWANHDSSDTFVFFSIGQYIIPGETPTTSWHNTFGFIR